MRQAKGTDQPLLVLEDDAAPTAELPGCNFDPERSMGMVTFRHLFAYQFGIRNPSSKTGFTGDYGGISFLVCYWDVQVHHKKSPSPISRWAPQLQPIPIGKPYNPVIQHICTFP